MFGGKTTILFEYVKKHIHCGQKVITIGHETDNRNGRKDLIGSHDKVNISGRKVSKLFETDIPDDVSVIAIDECQFFDDLTLFCQTWAEKGVSIYAAGLHTTSDNKLWPNIVSILPHVDDTIYCHAICVMCGDDKASKTKAICSLPKNGILIGADESYAATCSNCHDKDITKEILDKRMQNVNTVKMLFSY